MRHLRARTPRWDSTARKEGNACYERDEKETTRTIITTKMKKSTLAVQHYRKAHGGKGCPSWQIQVNRLSHEEQEKNNEACREIEKLVRLLFLLANNNERKLCRRL